jgi:excisionase family DNA binding protein
MPDAINVSPARGGAPKPDAVPPACVRVADAGWRLCVSPRTVWRLISLGELKVVRVGRSVRVTTSSIQNFIDRGGSR